MRRDGHIGANIGHLGRRARWCLALCAGVLIFWTSAQAATAGTWALQSVPTRSGLNGQLLGISCASSTACVAVGSYVDPLGEQRALTEIWNGTAWSLKAAPSPSTLAYLRGVSCTAANACTAVGGYGPGFANRPLVARWNGSSWSRETVTPPTGTADAILTAVSCISSTSCTGVGSYITTAFHNNLTLAEHWDGSSWSQQATPNPSGSTDSGLNGISCVGATSCYAVGDYNSTSSSEPSAIMAEHWDGTSWTLQTMATPPGATAADLEAVACSADTACTAVGGYATSGTTANLTLAERWNGSSWTTQTTVNPTSGSPSFNGVSCPTATDCIATGSPENLAAAPLVEQWDGTTWTIQSAPSVAGANVSDLLAVSCTAASACAAVGLASDFNVAPLTLAESWDGINWSIRTTVNKPGAQSTYLSGVACTATPSCAAVGYTTTSKGVQQTLAVTWDGTAWTLRTTPSPSSTAATFHSVSCTAPSACTAVGNYENSTHGVTLAERWDGTSWTLQSTTNRSSTSANVLSSVSCASSTSCMAVGYYFNSTVGHYETLTEQWDGSSWTTKSSPNRTGATISMLGGVSCASATSCLAVGGYSTASGAFAPNEPLAEVWDGSKWTIKLPKTPSGATLATLSGVSCTSATSCMAAGGSSASVGATFPSATLAELWDGAAWTVKSTTNPMFGGFGDDSCGSATTCTAVGQTYFAEDWDGTSWSTDTLANLPSGNGVLNGVSCSSSTTCTAVGENATNYVIEPIFANSTFVDQIQFPLAEEDPAVAAARDRLPALDDQSVTEIRGGLAVDRVG